MDEVDQDDDAEELTCNGCGRTEAQVEASGHLPGCSAMALLAGQDPAQAQRRWATCAGCGRTRSQLISQGHADGCAIDPMRASEAPPEALPPAVEAPRVSAAEAGVPPEAAAGDVPPRVEEAPSGAKKIPLAGEPLHELTRACYESGDPELQRAARARFLAVDNVQKGISKPPPDGLPPWDARGEDKVLVRLIGAVHDLSDRIDQQKSLCWQIQQRQAELWLALQPERTQKLIERVNGGLDALYQRLGQLSEIADGPLEHLGTLRSLHDQLLALNERLAAGAAPGASPPGLVEQARRALAKALMPPPAPKRREVDGVGYTEVGEDGGGVPF